VAVAPETVRRADEFGLGGWSGLRRPGPPEAGRAVEMKGGTTFHFIDASPAEALGTARAAAGSSRPVSYGHHCAA